MVTQSEEVRRSIGYVSQAGGVHRSYARAGDEVVDHGMLYGMTAARRPSAGPGAVRAARPRRAVAAAAQDDVRRSAASPRHRDGADPRARRLVFLDEPTTGLDPQARANLWEHIADLRDRRGATVFLTTHYLDEADALSDRIIDHRPRQDRRQRHRRQPQGAGGRRPRRPRGRRRRPASPTAAERLDATPIAGRDVEVDGHHVRGRVPRAGRAMPGLLRDLDRAGIDLDSIEVRRPTLDDVFLTLTGRSLRDAEAAAPADPTSKEQCRDVPARELHRLPPPDADEPAQPRVGASSA